MVERINIGNLNLEVLTIVQNHVRLEDGSVYYMGPSSVFLYTDGLYKIGKPEIVLSSNLALIQQAVELIKILVDWLVNDFKGEINELLDVRLRFPNYPELYFKQNVQSDDRIFSVVYTTLYDELLKSLSKDLGNEQFQGVDPLKKMIHSKNFKRMLKNKPNLKVIKGGRSNDSSEPNRNGPADS